MLPPSALTVKGKGRSLGQPGKPGGTVRHNGEDFPTWWPRESISLFSCRPTQRIDGLGQTLSLVDGENGVTLQEMRKELFPTVVYLLQNVIASQGQHA